MNNHTPTTIIKTFLNNGSGLIIVPASGFLSTTIMAVVRAGPRFDPVGMDGLSHFIEHMLFRGTRKFPTTKALTQSLERNGSMAEAFTYYETNRYWVRCPNEAVNISVENLTDRIIQPLFKKEDIEFEKGVILEEKNILLSNPEKLIWEIWNQTIWEGGPLGRFYLGNEKSISSITEERINSFFKERYVGKNIYYIVVGNIKANDIIRKFNSSIKMHGKPIISTKEVPKNSISQKNSREINVYNTQAKNITISLGFPTVDKAHKDVHALDLISVLLAGGMGSLLKRELMEPGYTYSVTANTEYLSDTGYLSVNFTTEKKYLPKTLNIIYSNFHKLKNQSVDIQELDRAKGFYSGQFKINTETTYDLCMFYSDQLLGSVGSLLSPEDKIKKIEEISPNMILDVSKKYFKPESFCLAAIGNVRKDELIPFEI